MRNYGASTVLEVANKAHCAYAFDCLHAHLHGLGDEEGGARPCAFPNTTTALFCTWNMRAGAGPAGSWRLRGCIGTLEPRPLHKALQDYALTSAGIGLRVLPARQLPLRAPPAHCCHAPRAPHRCHTCALAPRAAPTARSARLTVRAHPRRRPAAPAVQGVAAELL